MTRVNSCQHLSSSCWVWQSAAVIGSKVPVSTHWSACWERKGSYSVVLAVQDRSVVSPETLLPMRAGSNENRVRRSDIFLPLQHQRPDLLLERLLSVSTQHSTSRDCFRLRIIVERLRSSLLLSRCVSGAVHSEHRFTHWCNGGMSCVAISAHRLHP